MITVLEIKECARKSGVPTSTIERPFEKHRNFPEKFLKQFKEFYNFPVVILCCTNDSKIDA